MVTLVSIASSRVWCLVALVLFTASSCGDECLTWCVVGSQETCLVAPSCGCDRGCQRISRDAALRLVDAGCAQSSSTLCR